MSASYQKDKLMNGEQLLQQLKTIGMTDEDQGHCNVLLDTWTGRVLSTTFHPEKDVRSMTILVASCELESQHGNLLAGGVPTTHGDVLDTWLDVCHKAIEGATVVATAYTSNLFSEVGWSASKFLESDTAKQLDDEGRYKHMNARLNWAATKRFVNKMVTASLDLEGDDRLRALKALETSDMYLEIVDKMLTEVDGQ